ncbi:phosphotransferase [Ligilactobacillus sp. WILCCON 0076]|uniref:Phosphotransferase n=1 Tax=Ligilactobacillus ubinensis TaxID=2876789 RepID=A0A9X2FIM3_9LACO|nr:phosphotransferase [Ligilactobacillus ubinensis]MCP0886579.1 phosphotransferase [Ligilactobacillus ubinensis]
MENRENNNYLFNQLTFPEKIQHLKDVGEKAKLLWGYPSNATLTLLNFTENATFSLEYPGMDKVILRVHRLEYASYDNIHTELTWILNLQKTTKLSVTCPRKSINNNYIEAITTPTLSEKRYVVCFNYSSGHAPIDSSDDNEKLGAIISYCNSLPNFLTNPIFRLAANLQILLGNPQKTTLTSEDRSLYQQIGKIAATLHTAAQKWTYPSFYNRIEWDFAGTFGKKNNFYNFDYHNTDWLKISEINILDDCVTLIKKRLEQYGKSKDRYGMIHSDLRAANLLQKNHQITVLDFDDCGMGWFMYDLASVVAFTEHRPDIEQVLSELITGYTQVRPLTPEDIQELWTFIMMRRIGLLQGFFYRLGMVFEGSGETVQLTDDVLAFFAKGTIGLAKRYLKNYSLSDSTVTETHSNVYQ